MTWTAFATIYAQIGPPMLAAVTSVISALTAWVVPILKYGIIFYLAARMLTHAIKHEGEPMSEVEGQLIKGALVLYVAGASGYTTYVQGLLLTSLPNEITKLVSGGGGGGTITGTSFDTIWQSVWVAGLLVFKNLPFSAAGIGLAIVVVVYWAVGMLSIALAFLIWLTASIYLYILIAVGPLFIGLFFFPLLRGLFDGWLGQVFTIIVLQALVSALVAILLAAETTIINNIATSLPSGNEIAQLQMLFGGMILFVICGFSILHLPGIAARIGGGVASDATQAARWSYAALGGIAGYAMAKATGGGSPSPESAESRAATRNEPPDQSLSDPPVSPAGSPDPVLRAS